MTARMAHRQITGIRRLELVEAELPEPSQGQGRLRVTHPARGPGTKLRVNHTGPDKPAWDGEPVASWSRRRPNECGPGPGVVGRATIAAPRGIGKRVAVDSIDE